MTESLAKLSWATFVRLCGGFAACAGRPVLTAARRNVSAGAFVGVRSGVLLLTLVFGLVFQVGCQAEGATWRRIEESGVIRVGLDPTYPPFELAEGDELSGLDVDLARAIADRYQLDAQFVFAGYDSLYDALETNQADVLISALVIVPERMKDFAYSESYFDAGQFLVYREETTGIHEMADLEGRTLAVELGAQGHVESIAWARRLRELDVRPYESPDEALAAVSSGDVDAAVIDAVAGRLYMKDHPELRRSQQPVDSEPYAMVVRAEDEMLLKKLNETLQQLRESGQLEAIVSRWLGE